MKKLILSLLLFCSIPTFAQQEQGEVLEEIVIDMVKTRRTLIDKLKKSKKLYDKHAKKNIYEISQELTNSKNEIIESFSAYARYKSIGYHFYDYKMNFTENKDDLKSLLTLSSFPFLSPNKYNYLQASDIFKKLIDLINDSNVFEENNHYYVYNSKKLSKDLVFIFDNETQLLSEVINQDITYAFKIEKEKLNSANAHTKYSNKNGIYVLSEMNVHESLTLHNKNYYLNFKGIISNKSKKEVEKLPSNGFFRLLIIRTQELIELQDKM